jgi:aspartate/methionine/tyrosine aminotransferase
MPADLDRRAARHAQTRDEILDAAAEANAYLFSDEMYRGLEHEPARQLPAAADLYEKAVSLSGLSKAYALPGLRIGWLATRDAALLGSCANLKDYVSICGSAPSEVLAIIALRAGARILARNRGIIADNLRAARGFCAVHDRWCRWIPPLAGSTAFPGLSDDMPGQRFADELLAQRGVMVAPGTLFGDPGNHIRLGLGRRNLPEALEQVGEYLEGLERRS